MRPRYIGTVSVAVLFLFIISIRGLNILGEEGEELELGKIKELSTGSEFDDVRPRTTIFGERLFSFWISATNSAGDTKIVYRVFDGEWGDEQVLISGSGQKRDLDVISSSHYICAIWITDDPDYTTGEDWDVVIRVFSEEEGWNDVLEVSEPDDEKNDFSPSAAFSDLNLYISWQSDRDEGGCSDILLRKWNQRDGLSEINNITGDWTGRNINPSINLHSESLVLAWASNDTSHTHGSDYDIILSTLDLNTEAKETVELTGSNNEDDDICPMVFVYDSKVHVAWHTSDKSITTGTDADLVIAVYDEGGASIYEASAPHDSGDDAYPLPLEFDGDLYLIWQSNDPGTTGDGDWDILLGKLSSEYKLTNVMQLTPGKDEADDGSYFYRGLEAAVLEEKGYIFWETKNTDITSDNGRNIVYTVFEKKKTTEEENEEVTKEESEEDKNTQHNGYVTMALVIIAVIILMTIVIGLYIKKSSGL